MTQQRDADTDLFLQPWVPDSLRRCLVVGARVRFHWSPECTLLPERNLGKQLDGETGIIRRTDDRLYVNHPYLVRCDNGILVCSAALELEPMDNEEEEEEEEED